MSEAEIVSKVEWGTINWNKAQCYVFKLQQRIYGASLRGDIQLVHKLQKLVVKSWYAKLLAVRQICEDSNSKNIAGVDGIKFLSHQERLKLAENLEIDGKSRATRQVWLPQLQIQDTPPLRIPTMQDRAKQTLFKLALEPEWEAVFEANSYGFRAGRSPHDAIAAILMSIGKQPKFVLYAQLAQCLPSLNLNKLLEKINTFPVFRRQIKAWFKSGIIDPNQWVHRKRYNRSLEGTAPGDLITPLLINILLHGMEHCLETAFSERTVLKLVRYADDVVILGEDLSSVRKCEEIISQWLKDIGLELEASQTALAHTLEEFNGSRSGFNFLGFTIRQFPNKSKLSGLTTVIEPSKEEIRSYYKYLADRVKSCQAKSQAELIAKLNPIIRNWCEERSPWNSSRVFRKLDDLLWRRLWRWAVRRHPNKGKGWVAKKYWHAIGNSSWVFATNSDSEKRYQLHKHAQFTSDRQWIKVEETRSPYDGNQIYWSQRMNLSDLYSLAQPGWCKQRH